MLLAASVEAPELFDFGDGLSLRIVKAPGGGWRVSDGRREQRAGSSIIVTEVNPPVEVAMPLHRSRDDAIAAARRWVATLAPESRGSPRSISSAS